MNYFSVRVRPVPWLGSCRATAYILLVHDPRGLTHAGKRGSISAMGFGVERRIALIGVRFLALNDSTCDYAMCLHRTLAALETFADRGAALHALRKSQPGLVIGMIAAERICFIALLVSGIIDRLAMDRPETLLQLWWVHCIGNPDCHHQCYGHRNQYPLHRLPSIASFIMSSARCIGSQCIVSGLTWTLTFLQVRATMRYVGISAARMARLWPSWPQSHINESAIRPSGFAYCRDRVQKGRTGRQVISPHFGICKAWFRAAIFPSASCTTTRTR